MSTSEHVPTDPEREEWDVIVVGTGMGGGTVGYELARRGRRVLFLEKGRLLHGDAKSADEPDPAVDPEADARMRTGRWPLPLQGRTSFGEVEFFAPLGCGSAGTTGLYGAQLERFRPADFRPRASFPDVRDTSLPEEWPVCHDEMIPYYQRAEALYRVCGTPDPLHSDPEAPLREPPPLSPRDQVLRDSFRELGLHPYRSHVGFEYVDNCYECDDICLRGCKSDAGGLCVVPALTKHDASILPNCEVLGLLADGSRVSGVRASWNQREVTLTAKAVALAAGAYMTPVLLLNSQSPSFPDGLANRSGLVGRNLMLHTSDFITIDPREWHSADGPKKTLALNDFYFDGGQKLGTLQSVGLPLEPPFILAYLRYAEERDPQWWRRFTRPFVPRVAHVAARLFRSASLWATIVEDLPYPENRIVPDPRARNGMRFEYRYTEELLERNRHFRRRIAEVLSPRLRARVVTWGRNNINYGHVCGTCRFGESPETSVLDRNNRAHDLDNLYVVDASFFPSSGGINPSLTIAANALRVGEIMHGQLP
jgi:choline dehydrogenase-like flavoprotein